MRGLKPCDARKFSRTSTAWEWGEEGLAKSLCMLNHRPMDLAAGQCQQGPGLWRLPAGQNLGLLRPGCDKKMLKDTDADKSGALGKHFSSKIK